MAGATLRKGIVAELAGLASSVLSHPMPAAIQRGEHQRNTAAKGLTNHHALLGKAADSTSRGAVIAPQV